MEELEPVLGEGGLFELLAHVVEVYVLEDNILHVETNSSHLRSSFKILDDVFCDATYKNLDGSIFVLIYLDRWYHLEQFGLITCSINKTG